MQIGFVGSGQSAAELTTQSTHFPVLVLQVLPAAQASVSRALHWSQVPPA